MVLVPEVLDNIRLASNAFRLCGTTKWWCRYTAAPAYMVLKTNIMNELKLYGIRFCPVGTMHTAYSIAQEESQS